VLRPHAANYSFFDTGGTVCGREQVELRARPRGWLASSRLELEGADRLTCDLEWHLEPDLSTHVIYLRATNSWGEEHILEAAVTGNGLIASRSGPEGPTQVEMGWGPEVELDHLSAAFTAVLVERWRRSGAEERDLDVVYLGDDLVPEPLRQHYRALQRGPGGEILTAQRTVVATGARAVVRILEGGVVASYAGLFSLDPGWRFTD
jgi:hypothetical protein